MRSEKGSGAAKRNPAGTSAKAEAYSSRREMEVQIMRAMLLPATEQIRNQIKNQSRAAQ
jgi:hypothetical protein